ncbi:hypothetical protein CANCADRAFT_2115 [Tortispora caseinolytica NRRL Y-17796]|uniref:COX assembly mitochondrial protein n=1 Tax=Tortispora caseinolytica NRRL Y-17796 TaxID=767744 RepID=A0A1E4TFD4_9ASCO|nr:hypothetical protein CANCADRAFT_2115 [Tortispora caseinolytica NRRL Y-17796]
MHPKLSEYRHAECADLIIELEKCHQKNFLLKAMGACNDAKDQLTLCLRQLRIDRQYENNSDSRLKQQVIRSRWSKENQDDAEIRDAIAQKQQRIEYLKSLDVSAP